MALSVNWITGRIFIPKSDLTLVSGTFYTFDTEAFRIEIGTLEKTEDGRPWTRTYNHNPEFTAAGTTLARGIEIIAPYTIEFEDGQYTVQLLGSNNNIWSVGDGILVQNQVQVIPTNSAGLINGGSNIWTEEEKNAVIAWAKKASDNAEQVNNKF